LPSPFRRLRFGNPWAQRLQRAYAWTVIVCPAPSAAVATTAVAVHTVVELGYEATRTARSLFAEVVVT